jgi:hypothetical protein
MMIGKGKNQITQRDPCDTVVVSNHPNSDMTKHPK